MEDIRATPKLSWHGIHGGIDQLRINIPNGAHPRRYAAALRIHVGLLRWNPAGPPGAGRFSTYAGILHEERTRRPPHGRPPKNMHAGPDRLYHEASPRRGGQHRIWVGGESRLGTLTGCGGRAAAPPPETKNSRNEIKKGKSEKKKERRSCVVVAAVPRGNALAGHPCWYFGNENVVGLPTLYVPAPNVRFALFLCQLADPTWGPLRCGTHHHRPPLGFALAGSFASSSLILISILLSFFILIIGLWDCYTV